MTQRHGSSPGAARGPPPPPAQMSIISSAASLPVATRMRRRPTSAGLPTTATLAVCNVAACGAFSPVVESVGLGKVQPLSSLGATKPKTYNAGSSSKGDNQGCARHSATNSDYASDAAARRCCSCPASLMLPADSDNTASALDNRRCMQQCLTGLSSACSERRGGSGDSGTGDCSRGITTAIAIDDASSSIKFAAPPAPVAAAASDGSLLSSTSAMSSQHRPLCSNSSSSSASTNPRLGDHQSSIRASLRPNSIFYRPRRRSVTPPHSADESDPPTTPNEVEVDSAYEPEPESEAESASNVDEDCDNEALRLIRQWEAEEDRAAELYRHEVATSDLARTLPFGRCIVEPDTRGFMYSHALSPATRPTTIPEERKAIKYAQHNFLRPTGEIVNTTIEYLELLRTGNVPIVNIPIDRRLSCEYDFIWNLIDNTGTDMWVAITCVILLKRYCSYKNAKQNAPYGSRHALYLGILMVAATHVHLSDRLDKFSYENILSIIGSPFTKADLVRLKRETLVALDHKAWVGTEDIVRYAKNNQFDIAHIYSSEELYKTRERMRSILRERKLREKEERRALCANLERFMHRAPHDAGGSWNPETSHCIEPRFLFRHLPWFPGAVNPLHVSARSEEIVLYSRDRKTKPIFSPLLPPLKDRNLKAFFET